MDRREKEDGGHTSLDGAESLDGADASRPFGTSSRTNLELAIWTSAVAPLALARFGGDPRDRRDATREREIGPEASWRVTRAGELRLPVCVGARARVWGARARAPRACALGIEEYVLY